MNFTLKTLVAAVALVAASSANAYQNGNSGNGNLVFVLANSQSGAFMYSTLTDKAVNDFVPTTTAVASSLNLTYNINNSTAFQTFSAANADTSKWAWAVVALDNTPTTAAGNTQNGGRRYLMTLDNAVAGTPSITSTQFGGLRTFSTEDFLSASVNEFVGSTTFGATDTWTSLVAQGITNAYGAESKFFYVTGRSGTALATTIVDTTGVAAKWSFGNNNTLTFTTTTVVPESDTYAMLLAGLGVMGMVARRRLAA